MSVIEKMLGRDGTRRTDAAADASSSALVITTMRRRDLKDGILEIERHSYPTPWSPSVFQSEIDQMRSGTRHYVTARRVVDASEGGSPRRRGSRGSQGRGTIVGHAGLWFTSDEAHVTNVAVHPDARRTGVGRTLMVALADEARRRRCASWTLEVRVSSTGAQELYRRFGFAPAGVRRRYYENVEDAIVMWCHDIQSPSYTARLDALRGSS